MIYILILEKTLELGRFSASSKLTLELGPDFDIISSTTLSKISGLST